ncbi:Holliday junction branch migration protein RuvA [Candidatus Beckwithbacteria bacterium CG22_combo_CG10-13_8_21_14_all_01_47_9]|uniref:Holliday junction branch migration complex subunit RuvA n=5 Tax=Candidatus Beckwithiibacteriota TaxID=1752726 RepID=A0A2H0E1S8_9BACT|nr:MAG: Holliday junction DNA helicase RuvA [Candidatus Beckwithbacteria bacterium CG1_02_47_37]PIP52034.1 MAG: Holliday junction branch migration protein RuvA [Candidatus Beckwithbacteria bacterium CG23_combo_of_CG06-09_8_20_14_all_47_9]PIP88385.1 MAG: Holliday junction branch migration protein RuvA [Candidatus Beckwithbacteria bacterium CG22_combo_CG10-13_8_21_14_all_01_47_9]PJA21391.1 MAG: Holliday junction branch migration protein RuvA [Candidatus Beckwithbacteria bacterium CG_4_10_14_0_2_um
MIARLTGKPERLTSDSIILDVNGVGYKVSIGGNTAMIEPLTLFIHTHVREDSLDLYGFLTKEELQLFKLVINISGIGPRTGMLLLNQGVEAVMAAIAKADVDFFTSIPRLGKKNAQKIIIELKPKLGDMTALDLTGDTSETKDAINALVNLGFQPKEARAAFRQAEGGDLDTKIKAALKNLGKNK